MAQCFCPMSDVAIQHIRALSESYRLMIAAANDYNGIALANRKQIELAIERADHLGSVIEDYLCSWENCSPCLVYSCGWEYCRRNLEVLNAMPNLPKTPRPANSQAQPRTEQQGNSSGQQQADKAQPPPTVGGQRHPFNKVDNREYHNYYGNPPQISQGNPNHPQNDSQNKNNQE